MKILILGVNGFIGSHLVGRILRDTTWEVYGMDLGNHKVAEYLDNPRFHFREGDISIKTGEPIKVTADHVIPLALDGPNIIDNVQPLCVSCNCSKGARHTTDYRLPETMFKAAKAA